MQTQMDDCMELNKKIIQGIPSSVVSQKLKREFANSRKALIKRSVITQSKNKMVTDWTIPKMLIIAKKESEFQQEKDD